MAQVPKLKKWSDANDYLLNLRKTIYDDIQPLLDTVGGAPFAINREIMCYIDHLGHLYSGKVKVGERLKSFLKEVMLKIDKNYSQSAEEIYQMYRCGTVHEFEPKILENNKGEILSWFCYRGERTDIISINNKKFQVKHLQTLLSDKEKRYWLPISTKCLIQDTIESINIFLKLGPEDERVTCWNKAYYKLSKPVHFNFKCNEVQG